MQNRQPTGYVETKGTKRNTLEAVGRERIKRPRLAYRPDSTDIAQAIVGKDSSKTTEGDINDNDDSSNQALGDSSDLFLDTNNDDNDKDYETLAAVF